MIRYANVDGQLLEPNAGLKGICLGCGNVLIAKCGSIKIHHWSHQRRFDCDPWWEPMTQWHKDWQNEFAVEWREVIIRDEQSGEFHRADIHTPGGLTIEFQHSSLSVKEIETRNNFYKKIIWVVNGQRFKGNFSFTQPIPNPKSKLLADYYFRMDPDGLANRPQFHLKKENHDPRRMFRVYSLHDDELKSVAEEFENGQKIYWLFNWKYKTRSWLNSSVPVFFDFGDEFLYWIKHREQKYVPLSYLKIIKKTDFLAKYTSP